MVDVGDLRPEQRAVVDQRAAVRDPADDSGDLDDPSAMARTYPGAFDEKLEEAQAAIEDERRSDHTPLEPHRSTDNERDRQI